jgi:oligopeptidase B
MKTPENATAKENWKDVIAHREEVLLEDIEILAIIWLLRNVRMD